MSRMLKTKAELDKEEFFRRRHANNMEFASPVLLQTVPANLPPPVAAHAMQTIDALIAGLGPRLVLLMMADTMMGMQVNTPAAQNKEGQIELGSWNRALYMLANDSVLYLEIAQDFELQKAAALAGETLPGEIKPAAANEET